MKINNANSLIDNNSVGNSKNIAFTSKSFSSYVKAGKDKLNDTFVLGRKGEMTRELFILTAFTFLLGGRLVTSRDKKGDSNDKSSHTLMDYVRDKNEIRETLIRDVPTIVIAVLSVPFLGRHIARGIQCLSGFAILKDNKDISKGTASYEQLEDWYKYNDQLHSKFDGFSERLKNQGGNLKKIYSSLSTKIKTQLSSFSKNNEEFITKLNLPEFKELKTLIMEGFKENNNKAFRNAKFMNTLPKIAAFIMTLGLIGTYIPKTNIRITEMLHKKKDGKPDDSVSKQNESATQVKELATADSSKAEDNLIAMKKNSK